MKVMAHVFEPKWDEDAALAGTWGSKVVLELGCGKGVYALALAQRYPEVTLVGVDVKGARMWHGATAAEQLGLPNVRFLRTRIEDLARHFAPGEVDEIWITFPDPHPRKGRAKRRLTSPRFLALYRELLKPGGRLHLKTDSRTLFDYSLETAREAGWKLEREIRDVHGTPGVPALLIEVQTDYEQRFVRERRVIYYAEAKYE